ncbi:hypothetical protein V6N12_025915 [Hibiscus sabdariffa]|uniref:Uncharacterized protein n=1 Tax=Hibiscus sabdariffa TaxID=183260 RepID=A0ABR2DQ77_9ROSI
MSDSEHFSGHFVELKLYLLHALLTISELESIRYRSLSKEKVPYGSQLSPRRLPIRSDENRGNPVDKE